MRLIHTADWHLCDRLGRIDRTDDLKARVERVAELCETHAADVLLIAGDLFHDQASLEEMKESLQHIYETFAPFFDRGGTILAVTGNHDKEARVELIRQGMRLATPDAGRGFRSGRMYLLNQPFVGILETQAGQRAQFILVPYPTSVRYGLPTDRFLPKAEENRALNNRVVEWMKEKLETLDPKLPTVLVGHLHVSGAGLSHTLFKVTEESDVVFDTGHLGLDRVQYVALGHIHKPQSLPGLPHVRYCGSLDHLHFDERDNETGVVLVEIGPMGLVRDPEVLPLQPTAMHALTIADPATELVGLAECVPDRDNTLVKIQATYIPGGPTRDEIIRAIRVAFPRYTEINWVKAETGDSTGRTAGIKPAADHRATVREFLTRELKDDPGRDALLKLAEEFLTTETKS